MMWSTEGSGIVSLMKALCLACLVIEISDVKIQQRETSDQFPSPGNTHEMTASMRKVALPVSSLVN